MSTRTVGLSALLGASDRAYLKTPSRTFYNDPIQYGHIDQATGYLFGGADPYGLAIASRLATSEHLAYTNEARADRTDRRSRP